MKRSAIVRWGVVLTTVTLTLAFLLLPSLGAVSTASAQDQVPAVETTVTEVPTATNTNTPVPTATSTPTPTNTPVGPTNTPTTPTVIVTLPPDTPIPTTPPSGPVPIPEPVTVVLFGTGLAALSAALASRRKTEE